MQTPPQLHVAFSYLRYFSLAFFRSPSPAISFPLLDQLTSRPPPTLPWSTQYWSIGYLAVQRVVLATIDRPFRTGGLDFVFAISEIQFHCLAFTAFTRYPCRTLRNRSVFLTYSLKSRWSFTSLIKPGPISFISYELM